MQAPWINDAEFIGYFVAQSHDWYTDEHVRFKYLPGGPQIVADQVLFAKKADLILSTPDLTVKTIIDQGAPFKIIATQYQKNPIGIVSLEERPVKTPQDLVGKKLAVPPANMVTVNAFLDINKIPRNEVNIVPYQYDPTPLIMGEVDATLDFVTNVPYTIEQRGKKPFSFTLYDNGLPLFNDTVVVMEETLKKRREEILAWMRASRRGWDENFVDTDKYPRKFADTYFKGTGRTLANEVYFNRRQQPLIKPTADFQVFAMSDDAIEQNVESLQRMKIAARRDMFTTELLKAM